MTDAAIDLTESQSQDSPARGSPVPPPRKRRGGQSRDGANIPNAETEHVVLDDDDEDDDEDDEEVYALGGGGGGRITPRQMKHTEAPRSIPVIAETVDLLDLSDSDEVGFVFRGSGVKG
jgi:hypothetical protein